MMLKFSMGSRQDNRTINIPHSAAAKLLPFTLTGCGNFVCDSSYFTEREGLAEWLYFATVSGRGILRYDGCEVELSAGRAAVIDCTRYHYYATIGDEPWHFFWMHFTGSAADAMVQLINGGSLRCAELSSEYAAGLYDSLCEIVKLPGRQTDFEVSLWIHRRLTELAGSVEVGAAMRYQKEMHEIAEYIREHLSSKLKISELARMSGLSEYHFLRTFRGIIGHPPYEYLTLLRIERAKQLLLSTDASINEIAVSVGYTDAKGLIENFRRHTGTTPSAYRGAVGKGIAIP